MDTRQGPPPVSAVRDTIPDPAMPTAKTMDVSLAETLAKPQAGAATSDTTATTAGFRSTVLPRVELVDEKWVLVKEDRARYEEVAKLGEGGGGVVVRVRDNDIGRHVAVKRLLPQLRNTGAMVNFVEEIRTVGRLEHPNIVPIHDVAADEAGQPFFVMKYVDGETLESVIAKLSRGDAEYHRRYPFERRVEIFAGVLEAIRYAHDAGIVHRDLKPANIMVGEHGEVMVMDWGIAKHMRRPGAAEPSQGGAEAEDATTPASRTRTGGLVGTPLYMSPEQARGEPADERSDIYSLCVLFHELLCLQHYLGDVNTVPAALEGVQSRKVPFAGLVTSPYQGRTPFDLGWFVDEGVAKRPEDRYPSVAAMIERLGRRREGLIPIQCPITFQKRLTREWLRFVDRYPIAIVIGSGVLLLGLIGLGLYALV